MHMDHNASTAGLVRVSVSEVDDSIDIGTNVINFSSDVVAEEYDICYVML